MALFSQSFEIGDNTINKIENEYSEQDKNGLATKPMKSLNESLLSNHGSDVEVIPESPTQQIHSIATAASSIYKKRKGKSSRKPKAKHISPPPPPPPPPSIPPKSPSITQSIGSDSLKEIHNDTKLPSTINENYSKYFNSEFNIDDDDDCVFVEAPPPDSVINISTPNNEHSMMAHENHDQNIMKPNRNLFDEIEDDFDVEMCSVTSLDLSKQNESFRELSLNEKISKNETFNISMDDGPISLRSPPSYRGARSLEHHQQHKDDDEKISQFIGETSDFFYDNEPIIKPIIDNKTISVINDDNIDGDDDDDDFIQIANLDIVSFTQKDGDQDHSIMEMEKIKQEMVLQKSYTDNVMANQSIIENYVQRGKENSLLLNNSSKLKLEYSGKDEQTTNNNNQKNLLKNDNVKNLNNINISNWNLPKSILSEYNKKGITNMFDWQIECLSNPKVLFNRSNLVYNAPTSAGKTLVSEILIIKTILELKKKTIIILPFISVAREKLFYLKDLLSPSGIRVEGYFGGYTAAVNFDKVNLAICTIEKANSIVNRLLEQQKLNDIGLIVIDEIHLISDPGRGYILELLLAKILYISKMSETTTTTINNPIQLITMSATLPESNVLTKWLNAEYYFTDYRPIQLTEMIKIGNTVYDNTMNRQRVINDNQLMEFDSIKDQDNIGQLCLETILDGGCVIIFCPSKDWCESLSLHIANLIFTIGKRKDLELGRRVREQINMKSIEEIKAQLRNCPIGLDSVLEKSISYSCAYHHAGLTGDERDIIESAFKSNGLRVIVATSTLSSGVNLPARRVIIRTPLFGGKPMNAQVYKQMCGRAGRKGQDNYGESILICSEINSKIGQELMCNTKSLNPITSCLNAHNYEHLKRAILEIIAAGIVQTKEHLKCFVNSTLYFSERKCESRFFNTAIAVQSQKVDKKKSFNEIMENGLVDNDHDADAGSADDPIEMCMQFLIEYEFLRVQLDEQTNTIKYIATRLGYACLASSMPPGDGFLLFSELQRARQHFVLESDLHAIYLVTPFSVCYQTQNLDWLYYLDLWEKLPESMKKVGQLIGISESFLVKAMRGQVKLDYKLLQIHKRFYTALALQELVNEKPITEIAEKYKYSRGLLQSLQQTSATFAGIVTSFCAALNWTMLSLIVEQFKERLHFGVHRDLCDLLKLQSLNGVRARHLFDNGIKTITDLANSNSTHIENVLYNSIGFDQQKQRDGETEYDARKRNNLRNLYITGQSGITISEAASVLIKDARSYLQLEMGVSEVHWKNTQSSSLQTIEINENDQNIPVINFTHDINKSINCSSTTTTTTNSSQSPVCKSSAKENQSVLEVMDISVSSDNKIVNDIELNCLTIHNLFEMSQYEIDVVENALTKFNEISVSLGINRYPKKVPLVESAAIIGGHLLINENNSDKIEQQPAEHQNQFLTTESYNFNFDNDYHVEGISICFTNDCIYYIDLQKGNNLQNQLNNNNNNTNNNNVAEDDEKLMKLKWEFFEKLLIRKNLTFRMYEAKQQLKILQKIYKNINFQHFKMEDPKIVHWLMREDQSELSITEMLSNYSPEYKWILERFKRVNKYKSIGLNYKISSCSAKIRCAIESSIVYRALNKQMENMINANGNDKIYKFFKEIEMPIQNTLAQMELNGFSVNHQELEMTMTELKGAMKQIESEIFKLSGKRFNISSSKEVAEVLKLRNNIDVVDKRKLSTAKQHLEKLNDPVANLIIQYRKLSHTLMITIESILMKIQSNNKIHGNSLSCTVTGRIFMEEPNIQNITKNFEIIISENDKRLISCRSAFKPSADDRCLLSADFCQLELRVLAHLSGDSTLLKIMKSNTDVFTAIASKWEQIEEHKITEKQRNNVKQICYGIIYGMGIQSLSESLVCTEREAITFNESFHRAYPGIRKYLENCIYYARKNGYVEMISGRRRYLPLINSGNSELRGQAERQAINTMIQGSAADICKYAILKMEKNHIEYERKFNGKILGERAKSASTRINFVLHLHDELIYDIPLDRCDEIGKMLKFSMENCIKLNVPLLVKLKCGNSWGTLKHFEL